MDLGIILNNVRYSYVIKSGNLISLCKGNSQPIDIGIERVANGIFSWYWAKGYMLYGTHVVIKTLNENQDIFYSVDIDEVAKSCLISNQDAKLVIQKAQITKAQWCENQKQMSLTRNVYTDEDELKEIEKSERFDELCRLKNLATEQQKKLQSLMDEISASKLNGSDYSEKLAEYSKQQAELSDLLQIIESKERRFKIYHSFSNEEQ